MTLQFKNISLANLLYVVLHSKNDYTMIINSMHGRANIIHYEMTAFIITAIQKAAELLLAASRTTSL